MDFSKTHFPFLVQKRALSLHLFKFFHNMGIFILKVFLSLLGWIKLAPKFKDVPAPTAIFKDFEGLNFVFIKFKDFQGASEPCM